MYSRTPMNLVFSRSLEDLLESKSTIKTDTKATPIIRNTTHSSARDLRFLTISGMPEMGSLLLLGLLWKNLRCSDLSYGEAETHPRSQRKTRATPTAPHHPPSAGAAGSPPGR